MAGQGASIPDLDTRIVPAGHLLFHWRAFAALSTDRQRGFGHGFGFGPIPWTAVDRYAERHRIDDDDERDRFERLIRAMDRAFLDWHAERED